MTNISTPDLIRLLEHHNRCYWENGEPEISDPRYDEIVEALRKRDPENPLLSRIYTPAVASDGKIRHPEPMLSLEKAYSLEEVISWAEKYSPENDRDLLVQPKYDGISARYDGQYLVTRGDGEFGENISDKIPLIELEAPEYVGKLDRPARGEIVIRDDDFASIYSQVRKKDGKIYKNSRNAVAGIMGLKDIREMQIQHAKLTLVDYSLVSYTVNQSELASQWEFLKSELAKLPYPQDGIVIKFADENFRRSLGRTAHHPRGEIAYKFTNIRKESRLLDVEWSFGKNCLTPVAILEPVDISGITIKRATLHNVQNIIDLDVQIGDSVIVERAGDVIPYIVEAHPGAERRTAIIENCPGCGTKLIRKGPELVCPNADCPETNLQRLLGAVRNLGIEHLGEPTLRKLIDVCKVRHVIDLFSLTTDDILQLDGFAAKSAANLVSEIAKARSIEDFRLLAALNITGIGPNIAKLILQELSFAELRNAGVEELSQIVGIGPERAGAIVSELAAQKEFLDELLAAVDLIESRGSNTGDGKTICFTGKMPEKRSFYEALARKAGFTPVGEANSTLTLLVADDPAGNSTKLRNARKFGTRIISLDEFLREIEENSNENKHDFNADATGQGMLF